MANKKIRESLRSDRPQDFFFFHNGITAERHGKEILPFAAKCLNESMKSTNNQAGLMEGLASATGSNFKQILKVNADQFELRWKSE
jgi:hypothetical protein